LEYSDGHSEDEICVDLRDASVASFVAAIFGHVSPGADAYATYKGDDYLIDPRHQIVLVTQLLRGATEFLASFSDAESAQGLWKIFLEDVLFARHLWDEDIPLADRITAIESVVHLYETVLIQRPFEPVDFRRPDRLPRRFGGLDYMIPDFLMHIPRDVDLTSPDARSVSDAFLAVFTHMVQHRAPIAQYAGLHGLGHLQHHDRPDVIDAYIAANPELDPAARAYAMTAKAGNAL
jgi:hypothetical protein